MSSTALAPHAPDPVALYATLHALLSDAVSILDRDQDGTREMLSRAVALLDDQAQKPRAWIQGGLAPWQAKSAKSHIEANFEGDLTVETLAKRAGLSRSAFSKAFKSTFNIPPQRYIAERRIERAKELMMTSDESLCQIAIICGFCDQSHLSRAFRQITGASPYAWRRANYTHRDDPKAYVAA